jgi:hypothetical protein
VKELSEKANIARRKQNKDAEERQKKLMREHATQAKKTETTKKKREEQTRTTEKKRCEREIQKESKRAKEKKRGDKQREEEPESTSADKAEGLTNENKKKPKQIEEQKGKRRVPKAEDEHGCKHSGLLGLMALPKIYLRAFVKEGGWLYKKPCKDCAAKETGNGNKDLVLDVASLLTIKGKQDVGYYCNCGPRSFGMKDSDELKALWTCDMVLCLSCFNERENKMSGDRTSKRCCRRR